MPIKNSPKCGPILSLLSPLSSPISYSRPATLSLSLSSLLYPLLLSLHVINPHSSSPSLLHLSLSSLSLHVLHPAKNPLSSLSLSSRIDSFRKLLRRNDASFSGEIWLSAASSIQRTPTSFLSYKQPSLQHPLSLPSSHIQKPKTRPAPLSLTSSPSQQIPPLTATASHFFSLTANPSSGTLSLILLSQPVHSLTSPPTKSRTATSLSLSLTPLILLPPKAAYANLSHRTAT